MPLSTAPLNLGSDPIHLDHTETLDIGHAPLRIVSGEVEVLSDKDLGFAPFRVRSLQRSPAVLSNTRVVACGHAVLAPVAPAEPRETEAATKAESAISYGQSLYHCFVLAHILCTLDDLGWLAYVDEHPCFEAESCARTLDMRPEVMRAMLRYLEQANIIEREVDDYRCSALFLGRIRQDIGFLKFMVKGYGHVLAELTPLAQGRSRYWHDIRRDDAGVREFFSPWNEMVMPQILDVVASYEPHHMTYFGSGYGTQLISLAERCESSRATGLEIDPQMCEVARERVAERGLEGRMRIEESNVFEWAKQSHPEVDMVLIIAGMFHDIENRRVGSVPLLEDLRRNIAPGGYLVIEDQNLARGGEPAFPLSISEGFEFLHVLMGAELRTREQYIELFESTGWIVREIRGNALANDWVFVLQAPA